MSWRIRILFTQTIQEANLQGPARRSRETNAQWAIQCMRGCPSPVIAGDCYDRRRLATVVWEPRTRLCGCTEVTRGRSGSFVHSVESSGDGAHAQCAVCRRRKVCGGKEKTWGGRGSAASTQWLQEGDGKMGKNPGRMKERRRNGVAGSPAPAGRAKKVV